MQETNIQLYFKQSHRHIRPLIAAMNKPNHDKPQYKQYVIYIGLAVLVTSVLNMIHGQFIGKENSYLLHITPTLAGILFGYLLTRVVILNKKLEHLATIDPLTGAYNRMQFNLFIEAEIDRANRYGNTFSVIFMDIDHFKRINDKHGHQTGDDVLKSFTDIIDKTNRASDIFSRYGGEEFVILAYGANIDNAIICAERLRKHIENYSFDKVGHLTCSFGVTEFRKQKDTSHSVLKRSDDALYKAKEAGRNCVRQA